MSTLDEKELSKLITALKNKGITLEQIQDKFDISRRTAYRWIDELMERGLVIYKVGTRPVKFHIDT